MKAIVLTLDIDWAPDFMIDAVSSLLQEHHLPATWFVTHTSPAIDRLRAASDLFELGIHPNFKPDSSQGRSPGEVLAHCMGLVPEAISIRTHGLIQSDYLWRQLLEETPIRIDCTTYWPQLNGLEATPYYWRGRCLTRYAFAYQDNLEMDKPTPRWQAEPLLAAAQGIVIFNFHPQLVFLNAVNMAGFQSLCRQVASATAILPEMARSFIHQGEGIGTMFQGLVKKLVGQRVCGRLCDLPRPHEEPAKKR